MRPLTPPPLPEGPARELHEALHELHHRAGWPSLRQMARGVGCSHTTLSRVFRSPEVPTWESLGRVVRFLHGDVEIFRTLWYRATGGDHTAAGPPLAAPDTPAGPGLHLVVPAGPASPAAEAGTARQADPAGPAPSPTIAELRRRVAEGLDRPLGSASHGDVGTQLDRFEERLMALCTRSVLDVLGGSAESAGPDAPLVDVAGRTLAVKLRPDLARERTLRAVLQDVIRPDLDPAHYLDRTGEVPDSVGRFDAVHLTVPREFDGSVAAELTDHLLVTLGAGYDVLERRAGDALASVRTSFDRAVSDLLADAVAGLGGHDVWILLAGRQRAWPAIAPDVVDRVLRRARTTADPLMPPVRQAYCVLADPSPLDAPLREALGTRRPVTVRTAPGPSRRRSDLLGLILPPGTDVTVLPLVVGERISVLAATPRRDAERTARALEPFVDALTGLAERY